MRVDTHNLATEVERMDDEGEPVWEEVAQGIFYQLMATDDRIRDSCHPRRGRVQVRERLWIGLKSG